MSSVRARVRSREGESLDSTLRRFKRVVEKSGIPKELRRREYHQKRSTIRKRDAAAAKKRYAKKVARDMAMFGMGAGARKGRPVAPKENTRDKRGRGGRGGRGGSSS